MCNTLNLYIFLAVVSLISGIDLQFSLEPVYRAKFFPSSRQVIRLLVLDCRDIILLDEATLILKLLHQGIVAVIIA